MDRASLELATQDLALPPGVLEMVLANLKRRHLLSIISFVCKRWRRAALASVKKLTIQKHVLWAQSVLSQMKTLTHVCIDLRVHHEYEYCAPLYLPPSVTSLDCKAPWASPILFAFPPLRRLSLHTQLITAERFKALLEDSHTSLAELEIHNFSYDQAEPVVSHLARLSLPSLTNLTTAGTWLRSAFVPFLARHASQLVSLTLTDAFDDNAALCATSALQFPLLRSLSLRQKDSLARNSFLTANRLAGLLNGVPHLTALSAHQLKHILEVPAGQLTCLVELSLPGSVEWLDPQEFTTLRSLPRLRSFHAEESDISLYFGYPDLLLRTLSHLVTPAEFAQDLLTKVTNIVYLRIDGDARLQLPAFPNGLTLPHLRNVRLSRAVCDAQLLSTLHCLLSIAPRIKRLALRFETGSRLGGNASGLSDILHGLLQRGCTVRIEDLAENELLRAKCDSAWSKLVVTTDGTGV